MIDDAPFVPTLDIDQIDLTDLELFAQDEADEIFRHLRYLAPIYWNKLPSGHGFWAITKYDDVLTAWKNTKALSSEYGNMLRLQGKKDTAAGTMMVVSDPPHHTRLRRIHNEVVHVRKIPEMEPFIRSYVRELLDNVTNCGEIDFMSEVAAKIPIAVTSQFIGIPRRDWFEMAELSYASIAAEDSEDWHGESAEEALASINAEVLIYFYDLIERKRRRPAQDLVSLLIKAEIDGERLTDAEIAVNCFGFLIGGNFTTKLSIGGGMIAFQQFPAEWERLQRDPSLLKSANEEILRWTAPNVHVMRVAKTDMEIRGQQIRQGDTVSLWTSSANRDEDVFPNPFQFDITRWPNKHVSFGAGPHYCIGSEVTRLEMRVFFEELLARNVRIEMTRPLQRLRSNFMGGYRHLYLTIEEA